MTRSRLPILGLLLLAASCRDSGTEPIQSTMTGQAAISDARNGEPPESNPHFYWLTPIRPAPPDESLGEVELLASPRVDVVCWESNPPSTCNRNEPLLSFTKGDGLIQELDLYKAEFATRGLTVSAGNKYTTYRIRVWTDPLTDFGGPFELGYADFRVVKTTAKTTSSDMVLVAEGRTLPIKFRLEKGAYEYELQTNRARGTLHPEDDEPLCQENCSVTIIPTDAPTVAALAEGGMDVTAMKFEANDVAATSVLVIDERTIGGDPEECADGVTLEKKYCYRYRITPDVPFINPVRFGICPFEIPLDETSPWRILKVDYDGVDGAPVVTRPPETDVSDFLPCALPVTPGALPRLLAALGTGRPWGGMANDLSDLFWAVDAGLQAVNTELTGTVAEGSLVSVTVRIMATVPVPAAPLAGRTVSFTITGSGSLSAATAVTDADGEATVNWTVGAGENTLNVSAATALGPISFSRTGTTAQLGSWAAAPGGLNVGRYYHSAVLLSNGKVLVVGGMTALSGGSQTTVGVGIELYDPADGSSTLVSDLVVRTNATVTLLPNGNVLIVGNFLGGAAIFNPATLSVTLPANNPSVVRQNHTATLLADGNVLIAGGVSNDGWVIRNDAELFETALARFTPVSGTLSQPRGGHLAALLPDGKVLVVGGGGDGFFLHTAEIFDPATGTFTLTSPPVDTNQWTNATTLQDGRVLVIAADAVPELFDPTTRTFVETGPMHQRPRLSRIMTLLSDGRVMVSGGSASQNGPTLTSVELFDPVTATFSLAAPMLSARQSHTATLLPDGRVLVIGGFDFALGDDRATAEFFTPIQ